MAEVAPAQVRELVKAKFELPRSADPVVTAAHKAHAEGETDRSLKILSEAVVPYTSDDIESGLVKRFGARVETGPDQGKKKKASTTEVDGKRHEDAKKHAENGRKYLEEGNSTKIQDSVRDFIKKNSPLVMEAVRDAVAASGGTLTEAAALDKIIKGIVDSDGFKSNYRQIYNERYDPNRQVEGEAEVIAIKKAIAMLEAERDGSIDKSTLLAKGNEVRAAEAILQGHSEFPDYNASLTTVGTFQPNYAADKVLLASNDFQAVTDEITNLKNQFPQTVLEKGQSLTQAQSNAADRLSDLQKLRDELTRAKSRVDAFDAAQQKISEIENRDRTIKQDYDQVITLQTDYQQLAEQFKSGIEIITPQRRRELDAEIAEKRIELADAEYAYDANKAREARDLTHMAQDATASYLNTLFTELTDKYVEKAAEAKTAEEQVLGSAQDKLSNAFRRRSVARKLHLAQHGRLDAGIRRTLHYWKADKASAEAAIGAYLSGGNEAVGALIGSKLLDVAPSGSAGQLQMKADKDLMETFGLTPAEIGALRTQMGADANGLMTQAGVDKFFQTAGTELTTKAISDYLRAGGHINKNVIDCITETTVGTEIITNALSKSKTRKEEINKIAGRDVTGTPDKLKSFMKEHKGLTALMIIALILGAGPLFLAAKAIAGGGAAAAGALR